MIANSQSKPSPLKQELYHPFNLLTTNYISQKNNARLISCTSNTKGCSGKHILTEDRNQMWVSEMGIPQSVTIDISNLKNRPQFYQTFAFYCWHSYSSNPATIELLVSQDGVNFISWLLLKPRNIAGFQYFSIDPISSKKYKFIQIVVRETYGASKTYMNCICMYGERIGTKSDGFPIEGEQDDNQNQIMEEKEEYEDDKPMQETGNFEATNSPQIKGNIRKNFHHKQSSSPDNYNTVTSSGAFTARNRPPLFSQRGRAIEREIRSGSNTNPRQSTSIRSQLSDQIESMQKQLQNLARKKKVNIKKLRSSHDNGQNPLQGTLGTFSSAQLAKTSGDRNIPRLESHQQHHLTYSITPQTARRSRSEILEFPSTQSEVRHLRKQMKNMFQAMSTLQTSFNLVCEKMQKLQDDNERLKQQVAFFGSTQATQPESERIFSQQCTLPLHPQNSNRQGMIRSNIAESSTFSSNQFIQLKQQNLGNLPVSNSAQSKALSRGQLSSDRRHHNPSSFNTMQQQPVQQQLSHQNIKYSQSPLQSNNQNNINIGSNPSPNLNMNQESVTEIKNEIADECITFCRDKINEFIMNQQNQNQIQSRATPDRKDLSQIHVEKILERKVEDFLGNIKDKLIDNYLQGSVRQRIYMIENKLQENFQHLKERFERKANFGEDQPQLEQQNNTGPAYSFSESKNELQMRQNNNNNNLKYEQFGGIGGGGGGTLQSEYVGSKGYMENRPVRDKNFNYAAKFEASKSQSSIGSELPEQTQNINELLAKLNMKLNQKALKLDQLEKEKFYMTPNKSNYNLLTNQRQNIYQQLQFRLMSGGAGNDGTTYLNVSMTTENQNSNPNNRTDQ